MQESVIYIVRVQEFGIHKEFSDYATAHICTLQLAKDYPLLTVELYKNTTASWEDE